MVQILEHMIVERCDAAAIPNRPTAHRLPQSSFPTEPRPRLSVVLARVARPLAVWRLWRAVQRRSPLQGRVPSVVLVGAPADVRHVLRQIEKAPGAAYTVVGVVLDGAVAPGDATQIWAEIHPALCYVGIEEVGAAMRDLGADAVVAVSPLPGSDQCARDRH